ncbi:MAG: glycosyltransferase [Candidatus Hydrogenedentes bacterium]|nr:glycosyltransferase [Candidatus Hydrogenedentota bacterium]
MSENTPVVSVVVPIFNEEPNIRPLIERLTAALESSGRSYEILAVDDGSSDRSVEILREFRARDSRLRIIRLSRNFGQSPALFAGFANVRGQIVATIDADLQNPPEELPKLIAKIEEGYDFVIGWRQRRQDSVLRKLPSLLLNALVRRLTKAGFRDIGCSLKVFRREVTDRLAQFNHRSRYLPAEVAWLGVRTCEVEVAHSERAAGTSKYGVLRLFRTAFDLVTSITSAPLQFIGLVGWLFAIGGFALGARVVYIRIVDGDINQMGSVIAVLLFLQGVHLISMGLICEYISRIYIEVQNRPYYIIKDIIE